MKPQRLKVGAIYHIVEKYGGEYVVKCLWRPVIVACSKEEYRFRSAGICYGYHPDFDLIIKLKLLRPKDLPLFINWPFRSVLFEELLKGPV